MIEEMFEIIIDGKRYYVRAQVGIQAISGSAVCNECQGKRDSEEIYRRNFEIIQIQDEDQTVVHRRRNRIHNQACLELLEKPFFQPICDLCLSYDQSSDAIALTDLQIAAGMCDFETC